MFAPHRKAPAELVLDELGCDARWTLIHATHLVADEIQRLASSGAVVGLCPTTEANLGDGVFPMGAFASQHGSFAIGTDSHVSIDPRSDLRLIEYAQRLTRQRRVVLGDDRESCGRWLCDRAWAGGARSLGIPAGAIALGKLLDLIVLDSQHPSFAGLPPERWLDALVFVEIGPIVRDCIVGGRRVVTNFVHPNEHESRVFYNEAIKRVLEN